MEYDPYIEFLRYCLDDTQPLPDSAKSIDWKELMVWAEKQAIIGIVYHGIEKAGRSISVPFDTLMEWIGYANQIEMRNLITTEVCKNLYDEFSKDGISTCILKGQANHAYYPERMGNRRTCGDIDIWTLPKAPREKQPIKWMIEYLEKKADIASICYLHAELTPIRNVPIEVHLRPSFLNEPIHNKRFQRLFGKMDECIELKEIDCVKLPVLKWEYDVIFQMCHIYRHLLDEGIGLRQVLDFFFLLRTSTETRKITNGHDFYFNRKEIMHHVERLGMKRFASALMFVLREVLAMPEEHLLCEASDKDGKFLLSEIMLSGNFGHSDPRMVKLQIEKGRTSYQIRRALRRIKRNFRFLVSYPSEVIWEPITRYEHFCWRKFRLWKF